MMKRTNDTSRAEPINPTITVQRHIEFFASGGKPDTLDILSVDVTDANPSGYEFQSIFDGRVVQRAWFMR